MNLESSVAKENDYNELSIVGATTQQAWLFSYSVGRASIVRASNRIEAIAKIAQARYNVAAG